MAVLVKALSMILVMVEVSPSAQLSSAVTSVLYWVVPSSL